MHRLAGMRVHTVPVCGGVFAVVFVLCVWWCVVMLVSNGVPYNASVCSAATTVNRPTLTAESLRNVVVKRLLWQLPKQIGSVPLGVLLSKHFDLVVDTGASVLLQELAALPAASITERWDGDGCVRWS